MDQSISLASEWLQILDFAEHKTRLGTVSASGCYFAKQFALAHDPPRTDIYSRVILGVPISSPGTLIGRVDGIF
jgi:hypothetical protein